MRQLIYTKHASATSKIASTANPAGINQLRGVTAGTRAATSSAEGGTKPQRGQWPLGVPVT
jgi:hypothetical protein